jgi:hypothetical protein
VLVYHDDEAVRFEVRTAAKWRFSYNVLETLKAVVEKQA